MQYCHVCRGTGNLKLRLEESKPGDEAVFVCYRCDGEGYLNYPYEIDDKDMPLTHEYQYRTGSWIDYLD